MSPPWPVGMVVECRYGTTPSFYPGSVESVADDGTYTIVYNDGDRETGVVRRRMRLPGQKQRFSLDVGLVVDARAASDEVVPGCISRVNADEGGGHTYDIDFDHGEVAKGLERKFIFSEFVDAPVGADSHLALGTSLECRYATTPKFYAGKCEAVSTDGLYTIAYDDGDRETDVVRRRIRLPGQKQRHILERGSAVDARSDSGDVVRTNVVESLGT